MATLDTVDSVSSSDLVVLWVTGSSPPYFGATISVLADAIEPLLTQPGAFSTQYSAPSATGFTVTVVAGSAGSTDIRLIIQPLAGYANGTIVLPAASTCVDHQRIRVTCTQAVTNLAFTLNGASGNLGAPTTLAANAFFEIMYDLPNLNWIRVG